MATHKYNGPEKNNNTVKPQLAVHSVKQPSAFKRLYFVIPNVNLTDSHRKTCQYLKQTAANTGQFPIKMTI